MTKSNDKRLIVLDILSGVTHPDSPLVESSVLVGIAQKPRPELKDPGQIWYSGIPCLLFLAGGLVLFREQLQTPAAIAVAILCFCSAAAVVWQLASRRTEAMAREARVLNEPLEELRELQRSLKEYMQRLDHRTRKYFHVVTNSKVTSYFVLTQIAQTLQGRIDEIAGLLAYPCRESLLISHQLLQGTLVFSDSFQGSSKGNIHVVPLARLKTVVLQIMEFLDSELRVLEEEFGEAEPFADGPEEHGEPN